MYEKPGRRIKMRPSSSVVCDNHPERKAIWRLTGETDSFGSEYHYECQECYLAATKSEEDSEAAISDDAVDFCEIGKHTAPYFKFREDGKRIKNVSLRTDPTEGGGRIYNICNDCYSSLCKEC